jgi:Carboxypeptidase regulatory-like domain
MMSRIAVRSALAAATAVAAAAAFAVFEPIATGQGAAGGKLIGHVKLTAVPPPNRQIPMGSDLKCLELNNGKKVEQETVLRDADGGLRNVFVSVQGSFPQSPAPPPEPVTIDQQGCVYKPRIQGARVGQTLLVKNDDDTLHNIHSLSTKGNSFNTGQPKAGLTFKTPLKNEEVMLHVKCDVHPWMTGYIGVVSHPYFAVSGASGAFTISNVPPGHYTVQAWHERYGTTTRTIDVKAGATTTIDFVYSGAEAAAAK